MAEQDPRIDLLQSEGWVHHEDRGWSGPWDPTARFERPKPIADAYEYAQNEIRRREDNAAMKDFRHGRASCMKCKRDLNQGKLSPNEMVICGLCIEWSEPDERGMRKGVATFPLAPPSPDPEAREAE